MQAFKQGFTCLFDFPEVSFVLQALCTTSECTVMSLPLIGTAAKGQWLAAQGGRQTCAGFQAQLRPGGRPRCSLDMLGAAAADG